MAKFNLRKDVVREVPDETFDVEGAERTYNLRHPKLIDALDLAYLTTDDVPGGLQAILGDDYAEFMAEEGMDGFAMEQVFQGWMAHYGIGETPGNGRAPRDYSPPKKKAAARRTSTPSKQTSRGTTRG